MYRLLNPVILLSITTLVSADVRSLFRFENERRHSAAAVMKTTKAADVAPIVHTPERIIQLNKNYRTHQGILDSAALVVVGTNIKWNSPSFAVKRHATDVDAEFESFDLIIAVTCLIHLLSI